MNIFFINCYEEAATGLRILASIAKRRGHRVRLVVLHKYTVAHSSALVEDPDAVQVCVRGGFKIRTSDIQPISTAEYDLVKEQIRSFEPNLCCVSSRSNNDHLMPDLLGAIHKAAPGIPIVCGGHGPSYCPETYLRAGATLVVRGEGEGAMEDILRAMESGDDFSAIPNICRLDADGNPLCNPLRPLLRHFEHIPPPLVDNSDILLIENNSIIPGDPAFTEEMFKIQFGRGCIGACSYCAAPSWQSMYRESGLVAPKYRRRNFESVLKEMETAKGHGVKRLFICDDFLVGPVPWLIAFFQQYKKRIGLPFKAHLHVRQLLTAPELLHAAIEAGLISLTLGFQSGDEVFSRQIYNRADSFADYKILAQTLYEQFICVQYHFISGTTLNTAEEFTAKLRLVRELPFDPFWPGRTLLFDFQFMPTEGSPLYANPTLKRVPAVQWAKSAMLTQISQVALEQDLTHAHTRYLADDLSLEEMQNYYKTCLGRRKEAERAKLSGKLDGRAAIFCGTRSEAYERHQALFGTVHKTALYRREGEIFLHDGNAERRLGPDDIREINERRTPIVIFAVEASPFARMLRRECMITSQIYSIN